jgi:hypothetical protein
MPVTITLPDELAENLQTRAEAQQVSLAELIADLLNVAFAVEPDDDFPTPEEVVAEIKATPPNPASIRPATGSLAEALQNAPQDPDFDLETWNKEWAAVEAEMRAITRANDIAEGRG